MTPAQLIQAAKDSAYPYVPERATATGPLLRKINQLEDKVTDQFALAAPERIAVFSTNFMISMTQNQNGYTLDAAKGYYNFQYFDKDSNAQKMTIYSTIIPERPEHPSAYLAGITLWPIDPSDSRWVGTGNRFFWKGDGDYFTYQFIADPPAITNLAATLVSPDETFEYFVAELALHIMMMAGNVPQIRIQSQVADRNDQWQGILNSMGQRSFGVPSFGLPRGPSPGVGAGGLPT